MNKQEVYGFLADQGIPYEITEHPPLNNVEELLAAKLPYPEAQAKNLFVRDDKKRHYYIITTKEQKRIDHDKGTEADRSESVSPEARIAPALFCIIR